MRVLRLLALRRLPAHCRPRRLSTLAPPDTSGSALRWAVGGWSFFIAENLILSENRGRIIEALGDDERETNYHRLYGSLSTAATASILYAYVVKARGALPLQWAGAPPVWRLVIGFGLQALGLAGMSQSLPRIQMPVRVAATSQDPVAPAERPSFEIGCPFDFKPSEAAGPGPHGLSRVSRHPTFWSLACVCLGAAAMVPSLPQAAWLAMPTAVALIGGAHSDSRKRRGMGGTLAPELDAVTSNAPFVAMLSGVQGGVLAAFSALASELKTGNALAGAGVAALWALRSRRVP
jgi:uncharacterized membrane protein